MEFYGNYRVYSESGIDVTLLKRNLGLTPTERWQQNFEALRTVKALREAGDARRTPNTARPGRS